MSYREGFVLTCRSDWEVKAAETHATTVRLPATATCVCVSRGHPCQMRRIYTLDAPEIYRETRHPTLCDNTLCRHGRFDREGRR